MADDKKNIPDAEKVDNPPEPGKVEPAKAAPPVQDQSAPAKTEAPEVEGAPQPGKDEKQTTMGAQSMRLGCGAAGGPGPIQLLHPHQLAPAG